MTSPLLTPRTVLFGLLALIPVVVAVALVLPQIKSLDLKELIRGVGYWGLFGIVFAESGLYFGFFCPAIRCCSRLACLPRLRSRIGRSSSYRS